MPNYRCCQCLWLVFVLHLFAMPCQAFTIEIGKSELQEKVSAIMPYEAKKPLYTLVVTDAVVDFDGSQEKIVIVANIRLFISLSQFVPTASIVLRGGLEYDPAAAGFFLRNTVVEKINLNNTPEIYAPLIKRASQTVASKVFADKPVYVINKDSTQMQLASLFLKSVSIRDDRLILSLGLF